MFIKGALLMVRCIQLPNIIHLGLEILLQTVNTGVTNNTNNGSILLQYIPFLVHSASNQIFHVLLIFKVLYDDDALRRVLTL